MSATRFFSGDPTYYNYFARCAAISALVSSATVNSDFPLTYLYDGVVGLPMRLSGSGAAGVTFSQDLNLLTNGGFETWSSGTSDVAPDGFVISLPTNTHVARDTVHNSGTYSAKLTSSSSVLGFSAFLIKRITVRPGEKLHFEFYVQGDGTNDSFVYVHNRKTDRWLNLTSLTWSGSTQAYNLGHANTFTLASFDFTMESFALSGYEDTITLEFFWRSPTAALSAFCYIDDVVIYPWVDFAAYFGASLSTYSATWDFQGSADNSAWSNIAASNACTVPNAFAFVTTAQSWRYVRLRLNRFSVGLITALHLDSPGVGEMMVGQSTALTFGPRHPAASPWRVTRSMPQLRNSTQTGMSFAYNLTHHPMRRFELPMLPTTLARRDEVVQDMLLRSGYGVYPTVLVPWDSETVVAMGRFDKQLAVQRVQNAGAADVYDAPLVLDEFETYATGL